MSADEISEGRQLVGPLLGTSRQDGEENLPGLHAIGGAGTGGDFALDDNLAQVAGGAIVLQGHLGEIEHEQQQRLLGAGQAQAVIQQDRAGGRVKEGVKVAPEGRFFGLGGASSAASKQAKCGFVSTERSWLTPAPRKPVSLSCW